MGTRDRQLAARRRLAAHLRLRRKPVAWLGFALTAVGVAVVAFPATGPLVVGSAAGWLLWFAGCAMFLAAIVVGSRKTFLGASVASFTAIGAGVFMHFHPTAGAIAASLLIAAVLIVDGAFELALALDLRPLAAWRWVLASAMAAVGAGALMAAAAAGAMILQAALLGLALTGCGLALLVTVRRHSRPPSRASSASLHPPAEPA